MVLTLRITMNLFVLMMMQIPVMTVQQVLIIHLMMDLIMMLTVHVMQVMKMMIMIMH